MKVLVKRDRTFPEERHETGVSVLGGSPLWDREGIHVARSQRPGGAKSSPQRTDRQTRAISVPWSQRAEHTRQPKQTGSEF